jgi:hypothetical protein
VPQAHVAEPVFAAKRTATTSPSIIAGHTTSPSVGTCSFGLVGYVYDQLTGDSGSGDRVGAFESRVIGVGPQLGYLFPVGEHTQGYMNLKGYGEFDEAHRPGGVNVWLTFAFSPAAPRN